jgi:hypothetical protein
VEQSWLTFTPAEFCKVACKNQSGFLATEQAVDFPD